MKKREHRLFIRVTDEERNCILDKMYGMGIHSLSAYIRKMALDGYCLNLDLRVMSPTSYQTAPPRDIYFFAFQRLSLTAQV